MTCRTACETKDHASLGACLRAAHIRTGAVDATRQRKWDAELDLYRSARAQGIQPATTKTRDIRHALDRSDQVGRPYGIGGVR